MTRLRGLTLVLAGLACLPWGPLGWADHGAAPLANAEPESILPWARTVAERAVNGSTNADTGDPLFDAEWALVTCQMTNIALAQIVSADPRRRDEFLPAVRACSGQLLDPATRAFGTALWNEDGLSEDALASDRGHAYLGWLASGLSAARLVDPDPPWRAEHDRLIAGLARRLELAPDAIETYPEQRFSADIASLVAAVALHARATDRPEPRLAPFLVSFKHALISERGWVRHHPGSAPRGSTTAVTSWFLGFADASVAREIDEAYVTTCGATLGFGTCREYPPGVSGPMDIDSGPIFFGAGVSATGFSIGPAMRRGDAPLARRVLRTARLFGLSATRGERASFLAGGPIGDALLLAMVTTERAR